MSKSLPCSHALTAALLSALSLPAQAQGVLEINQACIDPPPGVTTGCFPGDSNGFPVTITAQTPGKSFRLTSDLSVSSGNTAIEIRREDVTIDLNGFAIIGPELAGSGYGIRKGTATDDGKNVVVHNGIVRGVGRIGIELGDYSRVERVQVIENRSTGISVGAGSLVRDNVVYRNRDDGIETGAGSLVIGNTVRDNDGFGLNLGAASGYKDNVLTLNNGGDANPQVNGTGIFELGTNICATDTTCP